ncbi:MAG: hypothetical protein ACOCTI_05730 [Phycisphaeraceae bacterium]
MKRMNWKMIGAAVMALAIGQGAMAATESVAMEIDGEVHSGLSYGEAGDWMQVGPGAGSDVNLNTGEGADFNWGNITSYDATDGVPGVDDDLGEYKWGMVGTVTGVDDTNRVLTYAGDWYLYAPNYAPHFLERGTFNMTARYDETWATAIVTGDVTINPDEVMVYDWGPNQDLDVALDWSDAGPAWLIDGQFSSETNTLTATVTTVPTPAAAGAGLALLAVLGGAKLVRRRKSA